MIYPPIIAVSSTSCPIVINDMKIGWANDPAEVLRLQSFLTNHEHISVPVTGVYDTSTEAAVKTFQSKYSDDILKPWGASIPSGVIHLTTIKKVNSLACSSTLTRTAEEQSAINKFKEEKKRALVENNVEYNNEVNIVNKNNPKLGPGNGINAIDAANAAAIGNLNITQRFWGFLKKIF